MAESVFCELDFGEGDRRRFQTSAQLIEFMDKHRSAYAWIGDQSGVGHELHEWFSNKLIGLLDQCAAHARNWASDQAHEQSAREHFKSVFVVRRVPIEGSPRWIFINQLRQRRGDQVAGAAIAALASFLPRTTKYEHLAGALEIANFDAGVNSSVPAAVKSALDTLRSSARSADARSRDAAAKREKQFEAERDRAEQLMDLGRRWIKHRLRLYHRQFESRVQTAVDDIKLVEKQYREAMRLKAPVEYWQEKAAAHEEKATSYRATVRTAATWGGAAVFSVLALITGAAIKLPAGTPIAAYASLAAFGALTTTAVLWLVRILVRLFLSQHHLALDARERATMALTYLALTGDGKAEEKDRTLVLTSLFRPTSDGIVKDDAAPDVGLSSLLSKALSKP